MEFALNSTSTCSLRSSARCAETRRGAGGEREREEVREGREIEKEKELVYR